MKHEGHLSVSELYEVANRLSFPLTVSRLLPASSKRQNAFCTFTHCIHTPAVPPLRSPSISSLFLLSSFYVSLMEVSGDTSFNFLREIAGENNNDDISSFDDMFSGVSLSSLLKAGSNDEDMNSATLVPSNHLFNQVNLVASPSHFLSHRPPLLLSSDLTFSDSDHSHHFTGHHRQMIESDHSSVFNTELEGFYKCKFDENCPLYYQHDFSYHLPPLQSIEHFSDSELFSPEPSRKIARFNSPLSHTIETILNSFNLFDYITSLIPAALPPPASNAVVPSARSCYARRKRKNISDKVNCLGRILPGDRKLDMATVLGETYKYVKFLEAQISVLQSMPMASSHYRDDSGVGQDSLNRQQVLEMVVSSPATQMVLYSEGMCVVLVEQVASILQRVLRESGI
ncbi:hypothetical protein Ancab_010951 [Ancistrocladus abbreviatus]